MFSPVFCKNGRGSSVFIDVNTAQSLYAKETWGSSQDSATSRPGSWLIAFPAPGARGGARPQRVAHSRRDGTNEDLGYGGALRAGTARAPASGYGCEAAFGAGSLRRWAT